MQGSGAGSTPRSPPGGGWAGGGGGQSDEEYFEFDASDLHTAFLDMALAASPPAAGGVLPQEPLASSWKSAGSLLEGSLSEDDSPFRFIPPATGREDLEDGRDGEVGGIPFGAAAVAVAVAAAPAAPPSPAGSASGGTEQQQHPVEQTHGHVQSVHAHTWWHSEAFRIARLAAPLTISNVGGYCIGMVAMAAVGRLGSAALSVVVLSTSCYNMLGLSALVGFSSAMETFCGQAYGAGSYKVVGLVLQRALLLISLLVALMALSWTQAERLLLALGQDLTISRGCGEFLIRAAPALWFTGVFEVLKRYLMAQEVVRPVTASTVGALALAPLYNWLLIYRLGLGVHGAAYAMVAVQATTACFLAGYCTLRDRRMSHSPKCTWGGWSRKALGGWWRYCRLALPSVAMLMCEWSMFQVMVVLAGWLPDPEVSVSAMGIAINTSGLAYMAVTGLACAVSVRVSNSLGAGLPSVAKRATWTGWALTMGLQIVVASSIVNGRRAWPALFTTSLPVVSATAALLPIVAFSIFGDGTSAVLQGLLRGGGKQAIGAVTNVSSYWCCGIPLAYFLAFPRGLGLPGLWWGLAITNTMQGGIMATISLCFDFPKEAERAADRMQRETARLEAQRAKAAATAGVESRLTEPLLHAAV